MGWKNVKEHYRIGHIVQVNEKGICIGSPYIHDIIVIGMDGMILKRYDDDRWGRNEDLHRYMQEFDADPAKLTELIASPDHFDADVTVYTYDDGKIIEKHCEAAGWPNVTHDGCCQYDNMFSTDKMQVLKWAKKNAAIRLKWAKEWVEKTRQKLEECLTEVREAEAAVAELDREYPGVAGESEEKE